MLLRPEPACLVIADISGYTDYLAGTELDHAQDILADLLGAVVGSLRGSFRLAKLEGDAAFVFAPTERIDASALLDALEATYFGFRRRRRDVAAATSCECNACRRIPSLDLKFVAHHGAVIRQRVAGREELVGAPVILVHRLLKNDVVAELGVAAYALFTAECLAAGEGDPTRLGLIEHRETYEHLGETVVYVHDLGAAWERQLAATRVVVPAEGSLVVTRTLPVPPPTAWAYLTSPTERPRWQHGVTGVVEETAGGRRGVGTTNHCLHGKSAVVEEILDWRPYEHVTLRSTLPAPGAPKARSTIVFEPVADGTLVSYRLEAPRSKRERAALEPLGAAFLEGLEASFDALVARLSGADGERDVATADPSGGGTPAALGT